MLSKKLALKEIANSIKNKKVLIRVDFNCPIKDSKVIDTTKISESLQSIKFAKDNGARSIILMSHLGRPNGQKNNKYTLKPVAEAASDLLNEKVHFLNDCIGDEVRNNIQKSDGGKIHLLENLRFYAAEEGSYKDQNTGNKIKETDQKINNFRTELTSLGDIYVNDAFGTCHRAHSSMVGIDLNTRVAGFLLKKELDYFSQVIEDPKRPLLVILGGAKVKDKISVILNMLDKVDRMIITGGMAFTFLKAKNPNFGIGNSLYDSEGATKVMDILNKAKQNNVEIILPNDFICNTSINGSIKDNIYCNNNIKEGYIGIDVGKNSIEQFDKIIKSSNTIFLNGSNGVFENEAGREGSEKLINSIVEATSNGAISICGGGDTVTLVNSIQSAKNNISHLSTGGGASMELIEGKLLPGINALSNRI